MNDIKRERVFIFKDRQMILIGEEGSSLPETELDRQNIHDGEIGVGDRTLIESFIRQTSRNVVSLDSYQDRPKFRRKGAGEEYLTRLYYLLRLMGFEYVRCEATSKVSFKFFTERMKMRQISKVQNTILKRLLLADDEETQSHLYRRL